MHTVVSLARELSAALTTRKRDNGESFVALADGSPDWMQDVCREAHGDMMPDDHRYSLISAAAESIADNGDEDGDGDNPHTFADDSVDIYNSDRVAWLASHGDRAGYCDDAQRDGLVSADADLYDRTGVGQYVEALEVYNLLHSALRELAESFDGDDDTDNGDTDTDASADGAL